ncbi:hypothetical protein IKX12_00785 [Candidatus Saccharibacteria bacterium]|nr:hypothetical protein [Candidatus Saccharibacteria bacterium]
MGDTTFSKSDYLKTREDLGITDDRGVTAMAELEARESGMLNPIVDPAINPIRRSMIRLVAENKHWVAKLGCPMDIEVSCDTTASMQDEVDNQMRVLPDMYEAIAKVLQGYDPQLCLGIFGDCVDDFVLCRPQYEMEAPKIVRYLNVMAPQRGGGGNGGEDPQYSMLARAYLTDAYTNNIGLKGYHFIITDEPCHHDISERQIRRIFGENIFDNELKEMKGAIKSIYGIVSDLKSKVHAFALIVDGHYHSDEAYESYCNLYGRKSVIRIDSTEMLPTIISAIIGLTEGTVEITELKERFGDDMDSELIKQLSNIEIGAQMKLRHAMKRPVPKAGDIFAKKGDLWPIQPGELSEDEEAEETVADIIKYL